MQYCKELLVTDHNLQFVKLMKRIPKIVAPQIKTNTSPSILSNILNYLTLGLFAGVVFEGSFLFFGFQNRVIKGVTANQLQNIKNMDQDVHESIIKGQVPKINVEWLRQKQKGKIQTMVELAKSQK